MSVFTRDTDALDCPFLRPFCETNLGPGPAMMNAATAGSKETVDIQYSDPTLRNPNAALDLYNARMAPEIIIGTVVVVLLVLFALGLWVALDERLRKRVKGWARCAGKRKDTNSKGEGGKVPNSPGACSNLSGLTRVNTRMDDVETGSRVCTSPSRMSTRGLPSPLRQDTTEGVKEEAESQPGLTVPALLTQS